MREARERADASDEIHNAQGVARRDAAESGGKPGGGEHAPGDGFAVEEAAVVGGDFECMGECVAEVEDLARAGFAFVFRDDGSFGGDGLRDDLGDGGGIAAEECVETALEERKGRAGANDGIFDEFVEAGAVFARGKCAESVGIGDDEARWVKGADEIFAFGEIDAGFAADGAIDLGEKSGGDMDESDAAEVSGGDEAGDIADNATAEGDEERVAVGAGANEAAGDGFDGREIFGGLTVVEEDGVDAGAARKRVQQDATPVAMDAR